MNRITGWKRTFPCLIRVAQRIQMNYAATRLQRKVIVSLALRFCEPLCERSAICNKHFCSLTTLVLGNLNFLNHFDLTKFTDHKNKLLR